MFYVISEVFIYLSKIKLSFSCFPSTSLTIQGHRIQRRPSHPNFKGGNLFDLWWRNTCFLLFLLQNPVMKSGFLCMSSCTSCLNCQVKFQFLKDCCCNVASLKKHKHSHSCFSLLYIFTAQDKSNCVRVVTLCHFVYINTQAILYEKDLYSF